MNSSELIRMINRNNKITEFNIIVKADVQGSLTSVLDSLKALDTDEVAVRRRRYRYWCRNRERRAYGPLQ